MSILHKRNPKFTVHRFLVLNLNLGALSNPIQNDSAKDCQIWSKGSSQNPINIALLNWSVGQKGIEWIECCNQNWNWNQLKIEL